MSNENIWIKDNKEINGPVRVNKRGVFTKSLKVETYICRGRVSKGGEEEMKYV